MKTLSKTQQKNSQRTKSNQNQKLNQVQPKRKASAANGVELDEAPEQLSVYDSYYKQLSEEVETIERHVRELRQILGLEHLTEEQAQEQIDFMLRFSAWVFNQEQQEQLTALAYVEAKEELVPTPAKKSKIQTPKGASNKKVTKPLSH